jgi:CheY-like chemotaxis protein
MARVNLTELRILIVDDSSAARSAVRMLLGEIGVYCVDSAAVRNADDSPNPYVPIIMVTTEATKMQLRNAMAAGVNDFMVKPVDGVMLRRRIVAILSSPAVFVRESGHLRPQRWKPQPQPTAARWV